MGDLCNVELCVVGISFETLPWEHMNGSLPDSAGTIWELLSGVLWIRGLRKRPNIHKNLPQEFNRPVEMKANNLSNFTLNHSVTRYKWSRCTLICLWHCKPITIVTDLNDCLLTKFEWWKWVSSDPTTLVSSAIVPNIVSTKASRTPRSSRGNHKYESFYLNMKVLIQMWNTQRSWIPTNWHLALFSINSLMYSIDIFEDYMSRKV